ncbi:histidine kinase [Dysgonomonas sp. HDW5B]|uniref:sensor histidine kinase n=1 Tax=Dysgonomonas sp. HDW5B TaxID=2714927 RepID=UPI001407A1FA|nr:histidine kinase [Dysgonomonas sp. HDW5B]QIK53800.1 histidine kinase [Dysgonomonas sp. HDW5B]
MDQIKKKTILYYLNDKKYHVHRHLLLQLFALIYAFDVFCPVPGQLPLSVGRFVTFLGFYLILNLIIYPNAYIFVPRYLVKKKLLKYILSIVAIILVCLFIIALIVVLFEKPNTGILKQVPSRNFFLIMLIILPSGVTFGLQCAGVAAFTVFRKWTEENQRTNDLKAATLQTELTFLKSQINPHFLFNIINNANILVDDEPEMASCMLTKLDDLLKFQLEDSMKEKVRLTDDIRFLTDYLDLEKVRRDHFEFEIQTRGNIDNISIAPLLFIPFVENAVKHNSDSSRTSYVNLLFTIENNMLTFICENSKPAKPIQQKTGGIGLSNISRRLNLLYDNSYSLERKETEQVYMAKLTLEL